MLLLGTLSYHSSKPRSPAAESAEAAGAKNLTEIVFECSGMSVPKARPGGHW